MEIEFLRKNHGSPANIIYYDKDDNILSSKLSRACHGRIGDDIFKKCEYVILYFEHGETDVSEADFIKWLEFCNEAGFYNEYLGVEDVSMDREYEELFEKCYSVKLIIKDKYVNALHLFCSVTVIRLISYDFEDINNEDIVDAICYLKKILLDKYSNLNYIILAHAISFDAGHSLISHGYTNFIRLMEKEELLSSFNKYNKINDIFKSIDEKNKLSTAELYSAIEDKNEEKLKQIL